MLLAKTILVFFLSVLSFSLICKGEPIAFNFFSTDLSKPITNFYVFKGLADTVSPNQIFENLKKGKGELFEGSVYSSGYTETVAWLAINVKNSENVIQNLIFEVGDPHINELKLYKISDTSFSYLGSLGDLEPFNNRPIANNNFVFPFNVAAQESCTLLLKIDNKGHTTMMPFSLTTPTKHYRLTVTSYLLWGIFTGVLLFVCLFSFFVWLSIKEKLFLFYSLYIIVVGMWVWANNGLGYQFLYPDLPHVMARIRLVMSAFGLTLMLHVMQLFVKQTKLNSRFYKATNIIKWLLCALAFILFIPYDYTQDKRLITTFLVVSDLLALVAVFLLFAGPIEKIKQGQKTAYTYLLAISFFFIASIFTLFVRLGIIPATTLSLNGVYISLLIEILILAIALGQHYNAVKKEEQRLQLEVENQKKDMAHKLELAAIMERTRIAADLHDEIGSGISGLRMFSEMAERKNNLEELKKDTLKISETAATLGNKIRDVIWTLNSEDKTVEDFLLYIQKYGIRFFENSAIAFSMEIPIDIANISLKPETQRQLLLVVKEIFNNALKHSDASKLECIIELKDLLQIYIEDNGKGFIPNVINKGHGLKNIKNRIVGMGGLINIDTTNGVRYHIQIPLV